MNQTKNIAAPDGTARSTTSSPPITGSTAAIHKPGTARGKGDYQAQFAWRESTPTPTPAPVDQYNVVFSDMLILGPRLTTNSAAGYNRRDRYETAFTQDQGLGATELGIPQHRRIDLSQLQHRLWANATAGLPSFQNIGEDFTFQDNFTQNRGQAHVQTGYEMLRTRYNATQWPLPGGTYNFGGTDAPFTPNTGNTFASFLLGTVTSATYHTGVRQLAAPLVVAPSLYPGRLEAASAGLTINLGVRWSYETPFQTKYGQQSQFDPTVQGPISGLNGRHHSSHRTAREEGSEQFAPRVGLAWNFQPKWVFRSSFGMIHSGIFATPTNIMFDEYLATATICRLRSEIRAPSSVSPMDPGHQYNVQPDGSVPSSAPTIPRRTQAGRTPTCACPTS